MNTIVYQNEPLTDELMEDISDYALDHLIETGANFKMKPEVWADWYNAVSKQGNIRIYTARNGKLVGYAVFFVSPHRHHKSVIQATQDLIYLAPEARKGMIGMSFLKWCDDRLRDEGVQIVYQYSSMAHDIGQVLSRMGYINTQALWARNLTDGGKN